MSKEAFTAEEQEARDTIGAMSEDERIVSFARPQFMNHGEPKRSFAKLAATIILIYADDRQKTREALVQAFLNTAYLHYHSVWGAVAYPMIDDYHDHLLQSSERFIDAYLSKARYRDDDEWRERTLAEREGSGRRLGVPKPAELQAIDDEN
jgi:hypothetical protein